MSGDTISLIFNSATAISIIDFLWKVFVLLIPVFLGILAWRLWFNYVRHSYTSKTKWITLQIKVPRDVFKTPQAMEFIFINAMHQTYPSTWYPAYVKGVVRSWFSLEIASLGGKVYFFMHIPAFFKNLIESQIYA